MGQPFLDSWHRRLLARRARNLDCLFGCCDRLLGLTHFGECLGEVRVGVKIVGVQRTRRSIMRTRILRPAELVQRVRKVRLEVGTVGLQVDRFFIV